MLDADALRERLTGWLPSRVGARSVDIADLTPPSGTGYSSETLLFTAEFELDGAVVDLQPFHLSPGAELDVDVVAQGSDPIGLNAHEPALALVCEVQGDGTFIKLDIPAHQSQLELERDRPLLRALVQGLLESGITTEFLGRNLTVRGAKSVKVCTLLDRQAGRRVMLQPDYFGFLLDEKYVFGYGLGSPNLGRNLPFIATTNDAIARGTGK